MNLFLILSVNFFLISLIAIGGVSAVIPEIHRIFVEQYHLLSDALFTQLFVLSQVAPGPNLTFVGLLGWELAGGWGATISLLSLCVPTLFFAVMFEKYGTRYKDRKVFNIAKAGLAPIAIGLLLSTAIILQKKQFNWKLMLLMISIYLIQNKWKINSVFLLLMGAMIGAFGIIN